MDRERTAPRVNVLGVGVSAVNIADTVATLHRWIHERGAHYVCVTGVHGVMESQRDPSLRRIHNDADLVTPDGMPLVWIGWASGHDRMTRVYGPDLLLAMCAAPSATQLRHFFFGSTPEVLSRLIDRLRIRFPHLNVCGTIAPPYHAISDDQDASLTDAINAASPDIVWVGLGTPKQERWMAAHLGRIDAPVLIGVGAAFDFISGAKRQAPRWMQRSGLEWLFRLGSEPRRLARRYLINNPAFLWQLLLQSIGVRHHKLDEST